MTETKASFKRTNENIDNAQPTKKLKETYDISALLQEQPEDTVEAKDKQIERLKDALRDTHESLTNWKDACPEYEPETIKTELSSMKTLKAQLQEARKRDRSLVMRLSTKEQEIHDLQMQVNDFRQALSPHTRQLIGTLFDPAVNLYIQKLKDEINLLKRKLKQANDDVEAQKFTPHSVTGRKLMMKCRSLQEENEELGKQISEGRIHKLSQEIALQREYAEELKASLAEANEFVLQLDQEVEALQQTIFVLQKQLKAYKAREAKQQPTSSGHDRSESGEEGKSASLGQGQSEFGPEGKPQALPSLGQGSSGNPELGGGDKLPISSLGNEDSGTSEFGQGKNTSAGGEVDVQMGESKNSGTDTA
eukprot:Phypoly_transcript_10305.p1 GENE.Phypoly_transcript_10305~~Phypoly_transcript_10305.p1  ORF type:complete len:364 (+),score=90.60 Phypoly_transcript_10305:195-1286(+)